MIDVWTMGAEEDCVQNVENVLVLELCDPWGEKEWVRLVERDLYELQRCYFTHQLPNGGQLIVTVGEGNTLQRRASDHCSEWVAFLRHETGWQGQVYNARTLLYLAPEGDVSLGCAYRARAFAINLHRQW